MASMINEELAQIHPEILKALRSVLGFMVNSHSWETGEYIDYDKQLINKRIKMAGGE